MAVLQVPVQTKEIEDVTHNVILLHTILPSFVTILVLLRLYSRCFYLRSAGKDDWLLVAGYVGSPLRFGVFN